jgi:hypothetical protein
MKLKRPHSPRGERGAREIVATVGSVAKRMLGTSESDLLKKAREIAFVPESFDDSPPRFFPVEISSSRIDAYFTVMDPATTLTNFATESNGGDDGKGVSVQNSHRTDELGWGRSVTGEKVETTDDAGDPLSIVRSIFFTVPDYAPAGINSNYLIRGIDHGLITDISVGFYGGEYRCGLCGGDMFAGWFGMWGVECDHVPGMTYDRLDPVTGDVVAQDLAFARIVDAHLSEYSTVYDGATPGASILKARAMAEAGALAPDDVRRIEQRLAPQLRAHGIRLPGGSHVFPGWSPPEGDERLVLPGGGTMRTAVQAAKAKARAGASPDTITTDAATDKPKRTASAAKISARDVTEVDDAEDTELELDDTVDETDESEDTEITLDDAEDTEDTDDDGERGLVTQADYDTLRTTVATETEGRIKLGVNPLDAIRALVAGVETLRTRASEAKAVRAQFIESILHEGARAHGTAFDRKRWKATLERATPDELIGFQADFRTAAAARFDGKRHTIEGAEHDLDLETFTEPAHLYAN